MFDNNLPIKIDLTAEKDFELSDNTMEHIAEDVNEYLANKYGYLNNGWSLNITVSNINWELEE